ncbi:very short patch repair endonuclease [Sphingomonas sp. SUN039]|uniref:very short patch repair endonuclease n=1 Tax=Sphingomonas sp. SUN039 TaxID=2937787 RepID=UPI0028692674|nr:very short patch repair endonuclease [Sphingomonas sp. SUN039]
MMAGIRSKNTRPEIIIRRGLHRRGFRFRLHVGALPGRPDLVLPRYRVVVFVNGCFWHGHLCRLFKWPKSRTQFWTDKIHANVARDVANRALLRSSGWRVGTIWECALKGPGKLPIDKVLDIASVWLRSAEPELEIAGQ